ncbi:MAG: hypothetical protein Q4A61_05145 [Porphyromonadaceae bacterium]|nr:hypothetical protein [Porphyromonadaceae bacterium]
MGKKNISSVVNRAYFGAFLISCLFGGGGCSVRQNNAPTRMYHNLTTRYNVYYNGSRQFTEAYTQFLEGQTESYIEPIAFDPIAYHLAGQSRSENTSLGFFDQPLKKADKAIKEHSLRVKPARKAGWHKDLKQRAEQAKTEYNSVLYKAWLLRGQSQLYNGQLQEALSTFDYTSRLYSTQEDVRVTALLWQVKCLCLSNRPAEAKELFAQIDSIRWQNSPQYMGVRAEYHLAMGQVSEAIDWLSRYTPKVKPRQQRMRLYYLLGQLCQTEGRSAKAYGAFKQVLSYFPPPALEFAARLRCAELSPSGKTATRSTLQRMTSRQRYRDYLDQIYYALGKNYLSARDTTSALRSFALAVDSSRHQGLDFALAQMAQGDIYLVRKKYPQAADKYKAALGALSKEDSRYSALVALSAGLERLRPSAEEAFRGDSLLRLARSPEPYRLQVIDSTILALKKRDAEEAKQRQRDSIAQANRELSMRLPSSLVGNEPRSPQLNSAFGDDNRFYFYNPKLLRLGSQAFERQWGRRPLTDLWRLSKRPNLGELPADTTQDLGSSGLGGGQVKPHEEQEAEADNPAYTRAFYLAQLPLSLEAQAETDSLVTQAMLEMGQILTLDLDLLSDAVYIYEQLLLRSPSNKIREEALFNLYILALRRSQREDAEQLRRQYLASFASTERGRELAHGDYEARLRSRDKAVAQAYEAAYAAYWGGRLEQLQQHHREIERLAPGGEHDWRTKFLLAMSYAMRGDRQSFVQELQRIAKGSAPEDISSLAGEILSGLEMGKPIFAGQPRPLDWGNLRPEHGGQAGTDISYETAKRGGRLNYILLTDSTTRASELLYHLSHYNYSQHTQETISVSPISLGDELQALVLGAFGSIAEAMVYREGWERYCFSNSGLAKFLLIPIGEQNIQLIVSREALLLYVRQMRVLELGGLYSSKLQARAEQLLDASSQSTTISTSAKHQKAVPVVLDFDIDRKMDQSAGETSAINPTDSLNIETDIPMPLDKLLGEPSLSYEEVQASARVEEKKKRAALKESEQARRAELKERERMQREVQRERDKLRREREKERERLRREKERLRKEAARKKK